MCMSEFKEKRADNLWKIYLEEDNFAQMVSSPS